MKKNILCFILPALIPWAVSNVYAASKCQRDFNEMRNSIKGDRILFSINGIAIIQLFGPITSRGAESCGAVGTSPNMLRRFSYNLSWKRGSWNDTLIATYPVFNNNTADSFRQSGA
ncbi:hypothetical protein [Candidatus Sororendozoicomonas aggregata]|uniref:hypothetical protein n=1 Tax=Candidatus Sororendozoicomonas aggregata TaxID=3073239 RepID=UPI002ED56D32